MICLLILSACSGKQAQEKSQPRRDTQESVKPETVKIDGLEYQRINDEIMGLTLDIPKEAYEKWTILYGPFSQDGEKQETPPVDGSFLQFMPMVVTNNILFYVRYYEETKWDSWIAEGKSAESITGCPNNTEIGREGGMVYIYSESESNETGMDEETISVYHQMRDSLSTVKDSIKLIPRASKLSVSLPSFKATDLDGKPVDSKLFEDYKMVMLNFWATFCGPCIEEMPYLQELSDSMPEGSLFAGVVGDALSQEYIDMAKDIADKSGVTYLNIVPDQILSDYINKNITGYPTTIFIDSKGNIIGDVLIGQHSKEEYKAELENRLKNLDSVAPSRNNSENTTQPPSRNSNSAESQPSNNGEPAPGPAQSR